MGKRNTKISQRGAGLLELLFAVAMMAVVAAAISGKFAQTAADANNASRASTTAFQDLMVFHRQIQVAMTKQRRDEYLAGKPTLNYLRYPTCTVTEGGQKRVRILSNYSDASLGTLGTEISIMTQ